MINVLYIDDEPHNLTSFRASFRREFNVFTAESAEEGRKILELKLIHVILSDQRMPKMTGIEFLESMRAPEDDTPAILLTTFDDDTALLNGLRLGAKGYLLKDVALAKLTEAIRLVAGGGR